MLAAPLQRRLLAVLAIGIYWAMLLVLTHLPGEEREVRPNRIPHLDKIAHAAAFAGLAVLACVAVAAFRPLTLPILVGIACALALYAAVDEFTQGWVRHRTPDFSDWLADMLGMLAGIGAFLLARRALGGSSGKTTTAPAAE
jgi:VanZ family protein